ncbi:hypothetical protein EAG_05412 [Camponotus floridanus]|uniref:Uncharacterized protein n=1 Tax=Camponotus floridanus TaxID=104421 RepID=E2A1Z2_CAMFO|nr:hypothetical protein EAG_05412 [Camponotus floridanus]
MDSFKFLGAGLDKLASYLDESKLTIARGEFRDLLDDDFRLLTRKDVFPYESPRKMILDSLAYGILVTGLLDLCSWVIAGKLAFLMRLQLCLTSRSHARFRQEPSGYSAN